MNIFILFFMAMSFISSMVVAHPSDNGSAIHAADYVWFPNLTTSSDTTTSARNLKKKGKSSRGGGGGKDRRRTTTEVRISLFNMDIDNDLTPEEIFFIEDTVMQVFKNIYLGGDNNDENGPQLRSLVVEDVLGGERPKAGLRGGEKGKGNGRNLRFFQKYGWFDIWALFETSCRFCDPDDDDRRELASESSDNQAMLREFETALCDALRDGPFEDFHFLDDCRMVYTSA